MAQRVAALPRKSSQMRSAKDATKLHEGRGLFVAATLVLLAPLVSACGIPFQPQPIQTATLEQRAQSATSGTVRISSAVPSPEETRAIFGLPLYDRGIQPVWLEIENRGPTRVRLAPVSLDPDYFSPMEVAWVHRKPFSKQGRKDLDAFFHGISMPRQIGPGQTRSGYVFTHAEPGTKGFNVDVFGPAREDHNFTFFVQVPGFEPDHAAIDFDKLYDAEDLRSYDADQLRRALAELPCCTSDFTGTTEGEFINVILVAEGIEVLHALLRARWYETTTGKLPNWIANRPHWDGRPPDAVFRKGRKKKGERNELRLWLSPMRLGDTPVWLGQVTHFPPDILGISFLDPDVDEARDYLLQDMWYSQGLRRIAWVSTGQPVDFAKRKKGHAPGSEYFTDGIRVVLWLSGNPVSLAETESLAWDAPPGAKTR